ncbi:MAG: hypothetical protein Q7S66_03295 [bacterium]|nr:hypothetical protein [bacterium]
MFGSNCHQIFVQKLAKITERPWLARLQNLLSLGGVHYYMHETAGWQTRVYLYNYFSFLSDSNFLASWDITVYNRLGVKVAHRTGELKARETQIIEVSEIGPVDEFGVIHVHVRPHQPDYFLPKPYNTIFFVEHYIPGTDKSIIAHSLGSPQASHFSYHRISTSWITPVGFRPVLFVANSCFFNRVFHPYCGRGNATFINYKNHKRTVAIPSFGPLACRKIDLFTVDPRLSDHLAGQPYSIEVEGRNILSKPFILQTSDAAILAEHL